MNGFLLNPHKFNIFILNVVGSVLLFFTGFLTLYLTVQYVRFNPSGLSFPIKSSKIYDRENTFLWEISEDNSVKHTWVSINEIPTSCKQAIVAVEDKTFWNNIGVDFNGLLRLAYSIVSGNNSSGGSTITQQVIKNAYQKIYNRTPIDKLNEIVYSIKLTQTFSKEKILELYLNYIFFGNLNYGIESASQDYFNKSVSELNLSECSYLMGIPQWPGVYNPYGNITLGKERQKTVLLAMLDSGFINEILVNKTLEENFDFNLSGFEVRAPHFIQFLQDNYSIMNGNSPLSSDMEILGKVDFDLSHKIVTTYNYNLHKSILDFLQKTIPEYSNNNVNNSAVVVLNNSGELLTLIGSVNFFDKTIDGEFNSALGQRQPGSLYLPLIYYSARTRNYAAEYELDNSEFSVIHNTNGFAEEVKVNNFNGNNGSQTTLIQMLSDWLPVAGVNLTNLIGTQNIVSDIANISNVNLTNCRSTLALEGCEKTLLEITQNYLTFNLGKKVDLKLIKFILSENSFTEYENSKTVYREFDSNTKKILTEISENLYNNAKDGWIYLAGDTSNSKDTMAIAQNENYTIGVWVGNTKGEVFTINSTVALKITEHIKEILSSI